MAMLLPFKGIYYDPKQVPLSQVIIPPYDVISQDEQKQILERSRYNFGHILLPKKQNEDYSEAGNLLRKWRESSIFLETKEPAYFLYEQAFQTQMGLHRRTTLMASVKLSDFSEKRIFPHEKTHQEPKTDRFKIICQTKCNLSPVLSMVADSEAFLDSFYEKWKFSTPLLRVKTPDGIENTLWVIGVDEARPVVDTISKKRLYILDGHHRYEVALYYSKEQGTFGKDLPSSYMFFGITSAYDPALVLLPTHRGVKGIDFHSMDPIEKKFELSLIDVNSLGTFLSKPSTGGSFVLFAKGRFYKCTPRDRNDGEPFSKSLAGIPVIWSDKVLLGEVFNVTDEEREKMVFYERDYKALLSMHDKFNCLLFIPPLSVDDVIRVADDGEFLPQKSTYFYPKLPAGLVFRDIS